MIKVLNKVKYALCLSALVAVIGFGWSTQATAATISVTDATAESEDGTIGLQLKIENTGGVADQLFAIKSPVAKAARLINPHEPEGGGATDMTAVMSLDIAPGDTVELTDEGQHIMLMDLNQEVAEGTTFPVTLFFKKGGKVTLDVTIQ